MFKHMGDGKAGLKGKLCRFDIPSPVFDPVTMAVFPANEVVGIGRERKS